MTANEPRETPAAPGSNAPVNGEEEAARFLPNATVRPASWPTSTLVLLGIVALLSIGGIYVEAPLPLMMVLCYLFAYGLAYLRGAKRHDVEQASFDLMRRGFPPLLIFVAVGALSAAWLYSGTVPAMVYYGSLLVHPDIFLPAAFITCTIAGFMTGSTFGTIGTIGVAMLGTAAVVGIPVGPAAGAVICGALFGDKMSPLSDTTVLAAGLADADLFAHIRHMLWTTGPAALISIVAFSALNLRYDTTNAGDVADDLRGTLAEFYSLGWPAAVPPIIVAVLLILRWDAFPTLMIGALVGCVVAVTYQGAALHSTMEALWYGYQVPNDPNLTDILAVGKNGVSTMIGLGSVVLFALGIAGCLAVCGILQPIITGASNNLTTPKRLVPTTLGLTLFIQLATGVMNFAVAMSTTLLRPIYDRIGVDRVNLSRAALDSSTMAAPLIPWGVDAIFITGALSLAVSDYLPYAFICFLCPAISLLYGLTGWTIKRNGLQHDRTTNGPSGKLSD